MCALACTGGTYRRKHSAINWFAMQSTLRLSATCQPSEHQLRVGQSLGCTAAVHVVIEGAVAC